MYPQKEWKRIVVALLLTAVMALSGSVASPNVAYASARVYVAPQSGTRYHCTRSCRGLRRANRVIRITKSQARSQGYTKCRICY